MAAKKKSKKRTKKKATGATSEKAATVVNQPESEGVDTYIFCRHRMNRYIAPTTDWTTFRGGDVSQLSFHQIPLPPPALKNQIELFAAKLDKYLLGLGYAGKEGARYAIRAGVSVPTEPMQSLLDVIAANYIEA